MKTVILIGSTRFESLFISAAQVLTEKGFNVLGRHVFKTNKDFAPSEIKRLEALELCRILKADIVVLISPNNYIGEATSLQIEFAKLNNIEIII